MNICIMFLSIIMSQYEFKLFNIDEFNGQPFPDIKYNPSNGKKYYFVNVRAYKFHTYINYMKRMNVDYVYVSGYNSDLANLILSKTGTLTPSSNTNQALYALYETFNEEIPSDLPYPPDPCRPSHPDPYYVTVTTEDTGREAININTRRRPIIRI